MTFQFTRPRGARPARSFASLTSSQFQFTRPRGARPSRHGRRIPRGGFQFTRPRGARRVDRVGAVRLAVVSIHAPTGGATHAGEVHTIKISCFNSRAHGGRDVNAAWEDAAGKMFQFTRPRGARRMRRRSLVIKAVSIHAPTGGATRSAGVIAVTSTFQFTRPRGARLRREERGEVGLGFNSRAHGGRDIKPRPPGRNSNVSIHAPTGGATRGRARGISRTAFQFTRPRGARRRRPSA